MNRISIFSALLLFAVAPLIYAQTDNCETLIQRQGIVSIPMQAGGRQTVAVLNTGTLPIGISRTLAESLGFTVEPVPSRNVLWSAIPTIVGQVSDIPVTIFGQDLQIEQMYVLDNPEQFVYLSLLMFSDFIMQMNFPQSRLCFMNKAAINMKDAANITVRNLRGRLAAQVAINKADPVWLEMQLEYSGAVRLNRKDALNLGFADADAEPATAGAMGAAVADSLQFGPYELGNIAVAYPTGNESATNDLQQLQRLSRRGGGPESSGALGYEILKHFVVTLDFKNERMHVYVPQ